MANDHEEQETQQKPRIATYLIDGFLGLLIVFLLSVMVQMLITKPRNFGVPRAYGFSFLNVLTDSMDGNINEYEIPSFKAGSGVVVTKVDPASLKQGDVVTFYEVLTLKDGSKVGIINTHRLMDQGSKKAVEKQEDGYYHFHTLGDNAKSESGSYRSLGEDFDERYLIGKVVAVSEPLGAFLRVISPTSSGYSTEEGGPNTSWVFPLLIFVPVMGIMTVTIVNTIRDARAQRKKEDAMLEEALTAEGIDRNDPVAVEKFTQKFFFKLEYREQMRKEKEKAKAEARENLEHERKVARIKAKKAAKLKEKMKRKAREEILREQAQEAERSKNEKVE